MKPSVLRIFQIVLITNILFSNIYAQIDIDYTTYSVEDGLSQSTVNCIYQDSKGFLWFGTQDGLNRYDGYTFNKYKHRINDTNSLPNNWIYSVDGNEAGDLWIGTLNGLVKYIRKEDRFIELYGNQSDSSKFSDKDIHSVMIGSDGKVWFKNSRMLCSMDTVTGVISKYYYHTSGQFSSFRNRAFPMIEDGSLIWICSRNGLLAFDRNTLKFSRYEYRSDSATSISDNFVTSVFIDSKGQLWVGTLNGLNLFDRKARIFKHFFAQENNPVTLSSNLVTFITEDHRGMLWIGTESGVNLYNQETQKFRQYYYLSHTFGSVRNNVVLAIYEDNMYNLWIGTEGGGLNKYDLKRKPFNIYRNSHVRGSVNLSNNQIASLYCNDRKIYVGTYGYGLNVIDRATNQVDLFATKQPENRKLNNNWVHVIFHDSRDMLWFCTRNGVHVYNEQTDKLGLISEVYPFTKNLEFTNNRIFCVMEDKYKNIWMGSDNGILYIGFDSKTTRSYNFFNNPEMGLLSNKILSMVQDKFGLVWIGTSNGLIRYDPENHRYKHYQSEAKNNKSVTNNTIYSLTEDSDGLIWIGTLSGLNCLNPINDSILHFTIQDGLPNDVIYSILEDNHGDIWFSTDNGLGRLNRKTKQIRCYDDDDGLQGLEFNFGSRYKAPDGELFFGGQSGFNAFYPDSITDSKMFAKIAFTWLEKISENGIQRINIESKNHITLGRFDYMFTIEFASLDYSQPQKNRYKYKMVGIEDKWIDIGTRRFATFSNLQPGEYILTIKGSNSDGQWSEEEKSLIISIIPPFWRTRWAYLFYGLMVIVMVYIYIEYRTKSLKISNQILREKHLAAVEISKQKEQLAIKNKSITDSITYAKRLQQALIPSEQLFKRYLPESFILFRSKDIVSGDFYWIAEKNGFVYIAGVDCTGHGVPGALMSIIGIDLLRNIILLGGIDQTAEILNLLNNGIIDTFYDKGGSETIKDGMDLVLCKINIKEQTLEFSGAMNSLLYLRDNRLFELKGNRYSIGSRDETFESYTSQTLHIEPGDMFYIFSDGYTDQFGGPDGKKLKYNRFRHLLLSVHDLSIAKQHKFLDDNFMKWKGALEQVDDVLVIGFKVPLPEI